MREQSEAAAAKIAANNETAAVALGVPETTEVVTTSIVEEPTIPSTEEAVASTEPAGDFSSENKVNMWDSIKTTDAEEEDLDIPPSLRGRLRK